MSKHTHIYRYVYNPSESLCTAYSSLLSCSSILRRLENTRLTLIFAQCLHYVYAPKLQIN